ncbi:Enoyl-(Acyl carrier protein) reductase [Thermomonospora echinospora]|uniref:Enoyl-(Acyl carrier protein) reductase n=1 Tax=Thermomonospora echinospora TaxID=1992 RepID=A0A1H5TZA7_9ACTN|nr:SDR family oxidoreductase [Thermomonospora echinospora]SEF67518.1 Enoyl-(Acyl carrier protein) reductase [Thermomonospora echinospora]
MTAAQQHSGEAGAGLLRGQWAVVTGGSKGIGYAIAERFVGEGANVLIAARDKAALDEAAGRLRALAGDGQRIESLPADLGGRAGIDALFDHIARELPVLNIFVANVGYGIFRSFLEVTDEEWDGIVSTNLTGTFRCTQAAARLMRDRPADNRAILVISSIRAQGARPNTLPYSTTKAGLNQLVRVAAYELAPLGIRVNALSPGLVVTPMALSHNPQAAELGAELAPLNRAGMPSDMAEGALYLCNPAASFVTGTNLVVDGGESLW